MDEVHNDWLSLHPEDQGPSWTDLQSSLTFSGILDWEVFSLLTQPCSQRRHGDKGQVPKRRSRQPRRVLTVLVIYPTTKFNFSRGVYFFGSVFVFILQAVTTELDPSALPSQGHPGRIPINSVSFTPDLGLEGLRGSQRLF